MQAVKFRFGATTLSIPNPNLLLAGLMSSSAPGLKGAKNE